MGSCCIHFHALSHGAGQNGIRALHTLAVVEKYRKNSAKHESTLNLGYMHAFAQNYQINYENHLTYGYIRPTDLLTSAFFMKLKGYKDTNHRQISKY